MGDLRTITGAERAARREEYIKWLEEVQASKDEGGAISTTHDIDAVIEALGTAIDAMKVIEDVITLGNDLLLVGYDSPVYAVAHAFNEEISKAIRGMR